VEASGRVRRKAVFDDSEDDDEEGEGDDDDDDDDDDMSEDEDDDDSDSGTRKNKGKKGGKSKPARHSVEAKEAKEDYNKRKRGIKVPEKIQWADESDDDGEVYGDEHVTLNGGKAARRHAALMHDDDDDDDMEKEEEENEGGQDVAAKGAEEGSDDGDGAMEDEAHMRWKEALGRKGFLHTRVNMQEYVYGSTKRDGHETGGKGVRDHGRSHDDDDDELFRVKKGGNALADGGRKGAHDPDADAWDDNAEDLSRPDLDEEDADAWADDALIASVRARFVNDETDMATIKKAFYEEGNKGDGEATYGDFEDLETG
jgi:hypothetical protein